MPRPALGKVAVGDRLLVFPRSYSRRSGERGPVEAVVSKVGRVWVELTEVDSTGTTPAMWKLRMDTQRSDSGTNYNDRFVTPEQYAWEQKISEAQHVVSGLMIESRSLWMKDEDRLFALADFVRAYDAEHPKEN